jgi:hypothetical protein
MLKINHKKMPSIAGMAEKRNFVLVTSSPFLSFSETLTEVGFLKQCCLKTKSFKVVRHLKRKYTLK